MPRLHGDNRVLRALNVFEGSSLLDVSGVLSRSIFSHAPFPHSFLLSGNSPLLFAPFPDDDFCRIRSDTARSQVCGHASCARAD